MNNRIITFFGIFLLLTWNIFPETISVTIEINGVIINGGRVAVAVFSNENHFKKKEPYISFWLESIDNRISYNINLPEGEYVVAVYQDENNNGKLDSFFFRPREPVGMTNYTGGIPGNFQKLKTVVNSYSKRISINLIRI
ncbi:MAG: DUF2141 domain-containing protein [Spirochaetaceae bacterium]|jgi:uncharacterized protein (DUF2141 family)|nr:DUF2141 domain-containing protein [Spirochaetaceae bacterium]